LKKLLFIFIPIIAILVAIFAILFTPSGSNTFIKPIVNSYIHKKIPNPKIDIEKLDSKYKYIDIAAKIDNGVNIEAKGDIDYFKKSFDIEYKVKADVVKVKDRLLAAKVDISGQAGRKYQTAKK